MIVVWQLLRCVEGLVHEAFNAVLETLPVCQTALLFSIAILLEMVLSDILVGAFYMHEDVSN